MSDIRLKEEKYTVEGVEYTLRCNMNVLAELQQVNDGNLLDALKKRRSLKTALQAGAAMINDCSDENGWPQRYTEKTLGRVISPRELVTFTKIVGSLLYAAIQDDSQEDREESGKTDEKNG